MKYIKHIYNKPLYMSRVTLGFDNYIQIWEELSNSQQTEDEINGIFKESQADVRLVPIYILAEATNANFTRYVFEKWHNLPRYTHTVKLLLQMLWKEPNNEMSEILRDQISEYFGDNKTIYKMICVCAIDHGQTVEIQSIAVMDAIFIDYCKDRNLDKVKEMYKHQLLTNSDKSHITIALRYDAEEIAKYIYESKLEQMRENATSYLWRIDDYEFSAAVYAKMQSKYKIAKQLNKSMGIARDNIRKHIDNDTSIGILWVVELMQVNYYGHDLDCESQLNIIKKYYDMGYNTRIQAAMNYAYKHKMSKTIVDYLYNKQIRKYEPWKY